MCCIYYVNIDLCRQGHQCHQWKDQRSSCRLDAFICTLHFCLFCCSTLYWAAEFFCSVHGTKFFASYWSYHFSLPSWNPCEKIFHGTMKITYYPNSVTTFNLARLATSGDISLNPGPDCKVPSTTVKKLAWKFPYAICEKPVWCNQKGIQCCGCERWHHIKCIYIDLKTYVALSHSQDCRLCSGNSCRLPFDFSDSFFDWSFSLDTTKSNDGSHDDSCVIYNVCSTR